jgi:hypothetical protein
MKKAEAKKTRKAPSREKYEKENPVVSFRVSKKLYDRLQSVKQAEGKSITDVLAVGVGLLEVKARSEEEIREAAYEQGRIEGFEIAESIFKVIYQCSVCGKEIEVESDGEKKAIKKYMREHGWGHASCINRR